MTEVFVEQPLASPGSADDIMSVLGINSGYTVKYNPLPADVPLGFVLGTPSGKGLYLTVYPLSRPNTDTVKSWRSHPMLRIGRIGMF